MPPTWEDIIEQALTAARQGRRYQIPLEELDAAASDQADASDPVTALSRVLKLHGLRADFNRPGRFVSVVRIDK